MVCYIYEAKPVVRSGHSEDKEGGSVLRNGKALKGTGKTRGVC